MLDDNVADFRRGGCRRAPKRGPALLAGLLRCGRCGRCGRKLMVGYSGKNRAAPRYQCHRARLDRLASKCISFGGLSVDQAVAKELLEHRHQTPLGDGPYRRYVLPLQHLVHEVDVVHALLAVPRRSRMRPVSRCCRISRVTCDSDFPVVFIR